MIIIYDTEESYGQYKTQMDAWSSITTDATCDFLHLWNECRDWHNYEIENKFSVPYGYLSDEEEEYDEDGYEQEEEEAYHDDDVSPESKAFIMHHLSDLGLTRPSDLP